MDVGLMGWGVINEQGWRKGPWTPEEDKLLSDYISLHGDRRWTSVARFAGLNRSGKSCRLRWVNYLRPGLKRGHLTPQEEGIIIELHALWGNKWSTIARYLPGRTDNEIKNYWRTHFKKRAKPSQRRERPKAFRHKTYQLQEEDDMNKNKAGSDGSTEAEMKNAKLIAEAQGNHQEIPKIEYSQSSPSSMGVYKYYEDAASWSDNISDDDLWGGLWSLDELVTCMNV